MVAKFRKKPVIVEAMRYDGSNYPEVVSFFGEKCLGAYESGTSATIDMPDGVVWVSTGDWIVKEEHRFYSCRSNIFEMTYEPVEED